MRNNRKNREAFGEHSFWQSYSDMMAALLLVFILIIAVTLAIYRQKTSDLEQTQLDLTAAQADLESSRAEIEKSNQELEASLAQLQEAYAQAALTQEELNKAYQEIADAQAELAATKSELENIVGVRTNLIGELQNTFQNSSMTVDAQTGSITFSSDVLFRYNSYTLTANSRDILRDIIPRYLEVLLQDQYREYIAEIIVEGHTDTDGGYWSNMELSYNRASAVARFCLDEENGLSREKIAQLQELLTVNGRSYSEPVYETDETGTATDKIDMAASRRVEIKFRLKEDEMIEKVSSILQQ
nr:OmpA family protein [uncultured Acetatifactor sp.]